MNTARDPSAFRAFEYEGWQGAADRYHESWSVVTQQTAGTMLDKLHVVDGCRFLDVASGPGYLAARAAEDVFPAYLQGTARMGALLRGQGPQARGRIQAAVAEAAQAYADADGKITIPMAAVLAFGRRAPD